MNQVVMTPVRILPRSGRSPERKASAYL